MASQGISACFFLLSMKLSQLCIIIGGSTLVSTVLLSWTAVLTVLPSLGGVFISVWYMAGTSLPWQRLSGSDRSGSVGSRHTIIPYSSISSAQHLQASGQDTVL